MKTNTKQTTAYEDDKKVLLHPDIGIPFFFLQVLLWMTTDDHNVGAVSQPASLIVWPLFVRFYLLLVNFRTQNPIRYKYFLKAVLDYWYTSCSRVLSASVSSKRGRIAVDEFVSELKWFVVSYLVDLLFGRQLKNYVRLLQGRIFWTNFHFWTNLFLTKQKLGCNYFVTSYYVKLIYTLNCNKIFYKTNLQLFTIFLKDCFLYFLNVSTDSNKFLFLLVVTINLN